MSQRLLAILSLVVAVLTAGQLHAQQGAESQVRAEIATQVSQAFFKENFAALEELAEKILAEKSRTPSGLWKLSIFKTGFGHSMDSVRSSESAWPAVEARINRWIKAYPQSPSAHIVLADVLVSRAWFYRGGQFASKVDPDAWKPFHENLDKARSVLQTAKSFASRDPRWYEVMIDIAKAQSWREKEYDALLAEALSKEPAFYQTYFAAVDYQLPKWGGNMAQIEAFVEAAVKRTAVTEGNAMYARIYWYVSQSDCKCNVFASGKSVWPKSESWL